MGNHHTGQRLRDLYFGAQWLSGSVGGTDRRRRRKTDYKDPAQDPSVSPDGSQILCNYAENPLNGWIVTIIRRDTGEVMESLPNIPSNSKFRWSADGQGVFYVRTLNGVSDIWAHKINGGKLTQVTHFKEKTEIFSFAPSPDGRWLAIVRGPRVSDAVLLEAAQ